MSSRTSEAGFRYWERNGKQVVALPTNLITHGANRVDISRLTNDPKELAHIIEFRLCEMMGMAGFSYKAMQQTLGLNHNEVAHRLKKVGVKVSEYRNGNSPMAKHVISRLTAVAQRKMVENLQKYLLK